jgi:hypothetical protein
MNGITTLGEATPKLNTDTNGDIRGWARQLIGILGLQNVNELSLFVGVSTLRLQEFEGTRLGSKVRIYHSSRGKVSTEVNWLTSNSPFPT